MVGVTVLQSTKRTGPVHLVRDVVFPVLAVLAIVAYADIRSPIGLPGHRGLIWLTLLVAVTLSTHRRATVLAVGASSTVATMALQLMPSPSYCTRYLAAAVLLYLVAGMVQRWVVAVAAAPIHLVAFLGQAHPATAILSERVVFHVGFGLVAGLLGWAIASGLNQGGSRE